MKNSLPLVTDGREVLLFSRGILARSLVRCGVPFQTAYHIATEIQTGLKPGTRYSKDIIARNVGAYLRKWFGKAIAERYEVARVSGTDIFVVSKGAKAPFSKGILVKSVRAAGIDANVSYAIAKSIEENLRERGRTRIKAKNLCSTAYEHIESFCGKKAAERYLAWRDLAAKNIPLVILLGGPAGAGKSTISVELASRLEITQVISTDVIREMMRTMFSTTLLPLVHKSSYRAWEDLDIPLNRSIDPVIMAFHEQALLVNVGTEAMIRRAIAENTDVIINGVHIVPGFIKPEEFPGAYIAQLAITVRDEDVHKMRFIRRQRNVPIRTAKKYLENFAIIRKIQDYLDSCAKRTNIPIIENMEFDDTCNAILGYLTNIITKQRGKV